MQLLKNAPKTVLCINDLSSVGRAGLSTILPVLATMGVQPIALPTSVLSTHTGGLGDPVVMSGGGYGQAALDHFAQLGLEFDGIYSGYLSSLNQAQLVRKAFSLWPKAYKVVDPVMGDHGRLYSGIYPELAVALRDLAKQADLILPNLTEAGILLGKPYEEKDYTKAQASVLAQELTSICPNALVTGIPMGKYLGCAGAGQETFVVQKPLIPRSYPGTGDLFGAVLIGGLCRGNALSAAADSAAAFVSHCIELTPPEADSRLGVWLEKALAQPDRKI